ncbi:hypothetical protein [Brevibacillus sp. 1238]|uniref:hypothetical protein n=1 Tax=Brevibacillus sp. 1238 TaxID=2940565 RepID=UPI0024765F98|nr:hypothetical protein [Brevibacillus sp. 1238]MDH6348421.1 hypothetical protein [Brevibacillus sp. 1238]
MWTWKKAAGKIACDNNYQFHSEETVPKYAKWIAKGTAILALLVAMTGCGAATEPKGASNETPAQQAAPAQDSVKMKMYKMPNGKEVQIPAAPKRIVSDLYLGQLLSIGDQADRNDWLFQDRADCADPIRHVQRRHPR